MEEKYEKDTKKNVSLMGGNLDPVELHFYQRKNSSAKETFFLDESEIKK